MYRSMMQVYVKGSDRAVVLYRKAFDAGLAVSYPNADGTFMHAELDVYGQIMAVSEAPDGEEGITGNTMQFCLHFGEGNEMQVRKAYETLKEGARIQYPPSPCEYSPLMFDLIDKYGVRWCIFV